MAEALHTVADVVAALGGAPRVAAMFGCKTTNTVYVWTATGRLPAKTYLAIKKELATRDKSASDDLWSMAEAAPSAPVTNGVPA